MGKISLNNIRLYAFHGCLASETKIGTEYEVSISVETDLAASSFSDDLNDTIDYSILYKIVKEEMAIPSKLLEHVARRIITKTTELFPEIGEIHISVSKLSPPIEGDIPAVTVSLDYKK